MKVCVRCVNRVKTNGHLCVECSVDWLWCSYKQHVSRRWKTQRVSMCRDCFAAYMRRRSGYAELCCAFFDCQNTFGGNWVQRALPKILCPEHRLTHRWCKECDTVKDRALFTSKRSVCVTCLPEVHARENKERKTIVLSAYSETEEPSCVCCGENYLGHLSIQHVNGDGASIRTKNGNADNYVHLRALLRKGIKREDLMTMCMNCNHAIGSATGVRCPNPNHGKTDVRPDQLGY